MDETKQQTDGSDPYNGLISEVSAMMMGGVSAQWMVRNQHVQQENLNKICKLLKGQSEVKGKGMGFWKKGGK